jgi:hypothetical protein
LISDDPVHDLHSLYDPYLLARLYQVAHFDEWLCAWLRATIEGADERRDDSVATGGG